jgi:glycosyltransferase involved in cell wall biosynthesis
LNKKENSIISTPKISVIIRNYNSEKYIGNAIHSALNQTLPKKLYEILIVDDGSEEQSKDVLLNYRNKSSSLIRILFKEHEGSTSALNSGIIEALGEFIIILDSDDEFKNEILEEMFNIHHSQEVDYVYSDYYEKAIHKQELKLVSAKDNLLFTVAAGIMFKKKDLLEFGLYDEEFILPEYDLLIKFEKNNLVGYHIAKPLFIYNRREGSITSNKMLVEKAKKQLINKWGNEFTIRDY